ncbi:MAG: hypothetical protein HY878_04505 [Deltaproteobacteria bacterium]|nr:hypothetical protein [Deltaproteobacteria bacterium]
MIKKFLGFGRVSILVGFSLLYLLSIRPISDAMKEVAIKLGVHEDDIII